MAEAGVRATMRLEQWVMTANAEGATVALPDDVLADLSVAPRALFRQVQTWLTDDNRWRRMIALTAFLRRLYAPKSYASYAAVRLDNSHAADVLHFDRWSVLGSSTDCNSCASVVQSMR